MNLKRISFALCITSALCMLLRLYSCIIGSSLLYYYGSIGHIFEQLLDSVSLCLISLFFYVFAKKIK